MPSLLGPLSTCDDVSVSAATTMSENITRWLDQHPYCLLSSLNTHTFTDAPVFTGSDVAPPRRGSI